MNFKKQLLLLSMITTICYSVTTFSVGLEISAPSFATPIGIQIFTDFGANRGGILMPHQTMKLDVGLFDGIRKIRFTEGCGNTKKVVEQTFFIPGKYGWVPLRLNGNTEIEVLGNKMPGFILYKQ